jgi:RNA polymerase sigma-70 factor (ECF subfamily)
VNPLAKESKDIIEFTILYNKHKLKLFNYVLKMVGDLMLAEDMIQNIFLKLYQNLESIRNMNSIHFWLFKTARNEIYTFYRAKKVRVDQFNVLDSEELEIESMYDLEAEYEKKELKEVILAELEKLPVVQKDIFLLKEYGGFSYKEIASILKIDKNLVKSRLFKVRQKLIRRIGFKITSD